MTKVRLKGLSIYQRRGKWFVYYRPNGKPLVKSFEGSRADLDKHIGTPAFLKLYGDIADKPKVKGYGTLGGLFDFYKTKDRWKRLAPRTRADYQKVIDWLDGHRQLNTPLVTITPADMAKTRDKAAEDRYPKFSNDALAFLSAAFSVGVEYGYANLTVNPVLKIRRLHKNSKTANRRWTDDEWSKVWQIAPAHLRPVLALARWAGLRGQDIASLRWDNITENSDLGQRIEYTAQKNDMLVYVDIWQELETALAQETKTTLTICKNSKGRPYPSENAMRKAWQDFKQSPIFDKLIPTGKDLTLHGLRVTFASELRERGHSPTEIADMIGDRTSRMGKHYSRGADLGRLSRDVKLRRMEWK
ncbi:MAG: tyrosine-type recombinase/integrase [Roseibium sp.]|nr:tyrosine-type recombinase/integrase [Roseibium sp.]